MKPDLLANPTGLSPTDVTIKAIGDFYNFFPTYQDWPDATHFLRTSYIPELLHQSLVEGKVTKQMHDDLIKQLSSPDSENWYVALSILIKRLKV